MEEQPRRRLDDECLARRGRPDEADDVARVTREQQPREVAHAYEYKCWS